MRKLSLKFIDILNNRFPSSKVFRGPTEAAEHNLEWARVGMIRFVHQVTEAKTHFPFINNFWDVAAYENQCFYIALPTTIKYDSRGQLHSENGPAIEFMDGTRYYYWSGVQIPSVFFDEKHKLTKADFAKINNSEVLRRICEKIGWDTYLRVMKLTLKDKWFDVNTKCHYELYENSSWNMPRLLVMESPELNDGTRPRYVEPVDRQLKTCEAARRWQCDPKGEAYVGREWAWAKDCNEEPALVFENEF